MKTKISYDASLMHHIVFFEQLTRAKLRDCFFDETRNCLTFVVEQGDIGKALGKGASNVVKLENKLKRKVRLVEFADSPVKLVQNLVRPLEISNVKIEGEIISISGKDSQTNGRIIGRNAIHLRNLEQQVRRYYPIKEIKVV